MSISPQLGGEHRVEIPAGAISYRACGNGSPMCSFTASASMAIYGGGSPELGKQSILTIVFQWSCRESNP